MLDRLRSSHPGSGLLIAMAMAGAVATGCGTAAPADAGGLDGGGMDAARDAGAPSISDAGPLGQCEGTPPACVLLEDETRCGGVIGCHFSYCGGSPVDCGRHRSQSACEDTGGCSWSGSTCGGIATSCAAYDDMAGCRGQVGCAWSTVQACGGAATPCTMLRAGECESQPGCSLRLPLPDAGTTPPDGGFVVPTCDPDAGRPPGCIAPAAPHPSPGCDPERGVECDGDWTGENPATGAPYCDPACDETECCTPRDGRFQCHPRAEDGSCPGADIFLDASRIAGRYRIEERFFEPTHCAVAEGCVNGSGMRRLLRFDTYTPNVGGADLYLGDTPRSGESTELYEWSGCHGHHHFSSYAEYELLTGDGCCVAVTGRKQAFCLMDLSRYRTDMGADRGVYSCRFQGIQRGWQDIYSSGLDCQWIDITDVPAGDYLLRIRLNTEHVLLESSYDNNDATIPVTIP